MHVVVLYFDQVNYLECGSGRVIVYSACSVSGVSGVNSESSEYRGHNERISTHTTLSLWLDLNYHWS